jgi:ABC-type antimicrobial peptide transport system permease subunit
MYTPSNPQDPLAVTDKTVWYTVVGVVGEMKLRDLVEGDQRVGTYYFAMTQMPATTMTFAIKTTADPRSLVTSVRQTINQLDRELPVFDLRTMQERTDRSLVTRRSPLLLSLVFGALALFLSAVGIYGVLAYSVTQRSKEFGIRIALGSSARGVFDLVLREGLVLIGLGLLVGIAGALSLRRALETQLFGVRATDPVVMLLIVGILGMVAVAACLVPARRATRIDPIVALAE